LIQPKPLCEMLPVEIDLFCGGPDQYSVGRVDLDDDGMGFEVTLVHPLCSKALLKYEIRFGKSLLVISFFPFDVVVQIGNLGKRKLKTIVTS
jgi:hypothetical protein